MKLQVRPYRDPADLMQMRHLVMIGSGRHSAGLVAAHASVRPINRVTIWSRTAGQADHAAKMHRAAGLDASATDDLEAAVRDADVVSTATLSTLPGRAPPGSSS